MRFFDQLNALVDHHLANLSGLEAKLLLVMLRYSDNSTGISYPSLNKLCELLGHKSNDRIREAIKALVAKGHLAMVAAATFNRSTRYQLTMEGLPLGAGDSPEKPPSPPSSRRLPQDAPLGGGQNAPRGLLRHAPPNGLMNGLPNGSCAHAASQHSSVEVLLTFPVKASKGRSDTWDLTRAAADRLAERFPSIDVLDECRGALAWCEANPTKQKTTRGIPAFLTNWLLNTKKKSNPHTNGHANRRFAGVGAIPAGQEDN